jgi:lysophospholipase L1-like esterase
VPTPIQPGQTLLFLGDHTSPGDTAYVGIMRGIIERFYPDLHLNLLSSGSPGQTARGLRSAALMEIIVSSKPDWLVIGIGLADVLREPEVQRYIELEAQPVPRESAEAEATFGPVMSMKGYRLAPVDDVGRKPDPAMHNLESFALDYRAALAQLRKSEVKCAVLTTVLVGNDPNTTVNRVLRSYNRAIRTAAIECEALLVDVEKACKNILDRAVNYKQLVALASASGQINAQGEALLARTTMNAFGILPQPGQRPGTQPM